MNNCVLCGLLLVLFCSFANGQGEVIDTVEIEAKPLRLQYFGGKQQAVQSSTSLSETLDEYSSVYIKNYGPGSLATSSIRGGSANHTLVLWNDLPIQNPFLGLLDLSLINTWAADEVTLQKGGNSAMWGSGAIGGVINIHHRPSEHDKPQFENILSIGTFDKLHEQAKLFYTFGSVKTSTAFTFLQATNNFSYLNNAGDRKNQINAAQQQENFNQDISWKINDKNVLSFYYWYTNAHREIPPTTVQNTSEAFQKDHSNRFSIQWKNIQKNQQFGMKAAYFIEDLNYIDPLANIESFTHFETAIFDANYELFIKNQHIINFGVSQFYTTVDSPKNYAEVATESKSAAFLRYKYKWFQLSGRQELFDGKWLPFMPAFAFEIPLSKLILLKGKVSRNYRLPTLNDRFWAPGGNPDLLAESGWSQESTLAFKKEKLNVSLTGFNRSIENWIQWALLEGGNYFQPYNLNKVWSRGLETELKFSQTIKNTTIDYTLGYDYVLSTNTIAVSIPKIEAGEQLFYTPIHAGLIQAQLSHKNIKIKYHHRFLGGTKGINEDLAPYNVGGAEVAADLKRMEVFLKMHNMRDAQYRVIERRPMPGVHYELGIKLKTNK